MGKKIAVIPIRAEDDFGLECLGCDVEVYSDDATVADFLAALDEFSGEYLADCRGCDGCCKERAPWIAADLPALAALAPGDSFPAHRALAAFGQLAIRRGVSDICFRRAEDGPCCLLDTAGKFCTAWQSRAFVCRSHFCIPRSDKFARLREEIVNAGENELTRLLLREEEQGAEPITGKPLAKSLRIEDYPANAQSGIDSYDQLLLKEILSPELWTEIKKEPYSTK